jgi:hypothetical protein
MMGSKNFAPGNYICSCIDTLEILEYNWLGCDCNVPRALMTLVWIKNIAGRMSPLTTAASEPTSISMTSSNPHTYIAYSMAPFSYSLSCGVSSLADPSSS